MKKKNDKAYVYKLVAVFTVVLVASAVLFSCAGKKEEPPEEPEEEIAEAEEAEEEAEAEAEDTVDSEGEPEEGAAEEA